MIRIQKRILSREGAILNTIGPGVASCSYIRVDTVTGAQQVDI
jgi:hypothetical protein